MPKRKASTALAAQEEEPPPPTPPDQEVAGPFYAVVVGGEEAILTQWEEVNSFVAGRGGMRLQSFPTYDEAEAYLRGPAGAGGGGGASAAPMVLSLTESDDDGAGGGAGAGAGDNDEGSDGTEGIDDEGGNGGGNGGNGGGGGGNDGEEEEDDEEEYCDCQEELSGSTAEKETTASSLPLAPPAPPPPPPEVAPYFLHQPITKAWLDKTVQKLRPGCVLDVVQQEALEDILLRKRNVFLTGSGGVGKSFLTKLCIDLLRAYYGSEYSFKVCVTASTGIASTHVEGTTLHSATGIGVPGIWDHFRRIYNQDRLLKQRWSRHFSLLFVDEISMLSGEMLDALDEILRTVRHRLDDAFGGLQVVMVGDFGQLPPIEQRVREKNRHAEFLPRAKYQSAKFWNMPVIRNRSSSCEEKLFSNRGLAFQSDAWWDADMRVVELTKVFRQDNADFIERLGRLRKGTITNHDIEWMNRHFFYRPPLASPSPARAPPAAAAAAAAPAAASSSSAAAAAAASASQAPMQPIGPPTPSLTSPPASATLPVTAGPAAAAAAAAPPRAPLFTSPLAVPSFFSLSSVKEPPPGAGAAAPLPPLPPPPAAPASAPPVSVAPPPPPPSHSPATTVAAPSSQTPPPAADPDPLHLYPTNKKVESRNQQKLAMLPSPLETYTAHNFVWHEESTTIVTEDQLVPWSLDENEQRGVQALRNNKQYYQKLLAADEVQLKLGAKVILLKNLDLVSEGQQLVNGSVGTIIGWAPRDKPEIDEKAGGAQGQGAALPPPAPLTPEDAERLAKTEGLISYKERVVESWIKKNSHRVPVVRFQNGRVKSILPELFSENLVGVGSTCRIQLPLMIAFAISIHKSQGLTLDQALVDVGDCFAGGQCYVAISRVGPREGLRFAQPLHWGCIKVTPLFTVWDAIRKAVDERKQALLAVLPPAERAEVSLMGLKSLHGYATEALTGGGQGMGSPRKAVDPEVRRKAAALKHALEQLRPWKPPRENRDEPVPRNRVPHWQTIQWR